MRFQTSSVLSWEDKEPKVAVTAVNTVLYFNRLLVRGTVTAITKKHNYYTNIHEYTHT